MTDLRTDDDPYAILGVARGSTDAAIASAHRALARRFHPDIAGEGATARMMRINAAFDAIRTAARRIAFDGLEHWQATPGRDDRDQHGSFPDEGYDPSATARSGEQATPFRGRARPASDGTGGAGPPPGRPSGSVLGFGRHVGWSIGEIARVDPGYLQWLTERREGRPYLEEIDTILRRSGSFREPSSAVPAPDRRRGVFRRG